MGKLFEDFGVDIAEELDDALNENLLDVTLVKVSPRERGSDASTGNDPLEERYALKGVQTARSGAAPGTLIRADEPVISFLGAGLPDGVKPEAGDLITIDGNDDELMIDSATWDPANAWYICECTRSNSLAGNVSA